MKLKDPVSGLTHLAGALLAVAGLVALIHVAADRGSAVRMVAFVIFGAALILLYTASAVYHLVRASGRGGRMLRRLDHMMIFILIAGSYTPFCLVSLRGAWGWALLGSIWGLAVAGVFMKIFWLEAPRWLSTGIYVAMGWAIVAASYPLVHAVSLDGLAWLFIGGLFYSVGAALYATKWPNPLPNIFGFHEIWHIFVMAGSLSHFFAVLHYV